MPALALKKETLAIEEYIEGEKLTPIKHEYINGYVYAMGGASDKHGLIAGNIFANIHSSLPSHCDVFMSDMKLHTKKAMMNVFIIPIFSFHAIPVMIIAITARSPY